MCSTQRTPIRVASEFESLIVIDRAVDLFTPLATQLTYEGLVDTTYAIDNSTYACAG